MVVAVAREVHDKIRIFEQHGNCFVNTAKKAVLNKQDRFFCRFLFSVADFSFNYYDLRSVETDDKILRCGSARQII
jgi:hypothetical protein